MNQRSPRRPVFFNLTRIQMPVGALTSITHRVTGIVLAFGIPFGFYVLHLSLDSAQSYEHLTQMANTELFKATLILFIWALSHHLLAGVRHLLMDIGVGSHLASARRSAWIVNLGGVTVALLAAGVVL
ncbi:MAG: succinate dehydrogenase, cytochrome b556 subunit [Pseudomonadota bacterium]|nr:succinate dehydrogenase, cytochrome b556 subunit [Pseudomonadota bacterium]